MVEQLWRYLLKSAQGESLGSLHFGPDGASGGVAGPDRYASSEAPRRRMTRS
jgi:hypothetical protein